MSECDLRLRLISCQATQKQIQNFAVALRKGAESARSASLFRGAGWLFGFGFGRGAPKTGHRHDEFDGDLGLAHKAGSHTGDPAEQFLSGDEVFDVNHLLDMYGGRQKYQRSVVVDDYGVRVLRDGVLVGVLEADSDGNPAADAFTAPAILRQQVRLGHDGHGTT